MYTDDMPRKAARIKKSDAFASDFLKTNPNFDTSAPPFEVRGCKVILGGAFFSQGVQHKCVNVSCL